MWGGADDLDALWADSWRWERNVFAKHSRASVALPVAGRELQLEQQPGSFAENKLTGLLCWDSTWVLARYAEQHQLAAGQSVLELGAGCGGVGLALAALGAASVTLTDLDDVLPLLRRNVEANAPPEASVQVCEFRWGIDNPPCPPADLVVAADVVYAMDTGPVLVDALREVALHAGARVLLAVELRNREALEDLVARARPYWALSLLAQEGAVVLLELRPWASPLGDALFADSGAWDHDLYSAHLADSVELRLDSGAVLPILQGRAMLGMRGVTAGQCWDCSWVLTKMIEHCCSGSGSELPLPFSVDVRGKRVLELGAGCGMVGLGLAALGAASVVLSDLPEALPLLEANVAGNAALLAEAGAQVEVRELDWRAYEGGEEFDLVVASDVVYQEAITPLLLRVLQQLPAGTPILLAIELRRREIFEQFQELFAPAFDVQWGPREAQHPEWGSSSVQMAFLVRG